MVELTLREIDELAQMDEYIQIFETHHCIKIKGILMAKVWAKEVSSDIALQLESIREEVNLELILQEKCFQPCRLPWGRTGLDWRSPFTEQPQLCAMVI